MAQTIRFYNDGCAYHLPNKRKIAAWIARCIHMHGYEAGELSFIFCSGAKHLEVNRTYLGHDYRTDVITFDYSDLAQGIVSGDIFIDPQTVRDNAGIYGVPALTEMHRVIIHGVLHLCGFGDKTKSEQSVMRREEDRCLAMFDEIPE